MLIFKFNLTRFKIFIIKPPLHKYTIFNQMKFKSFKLFACEFMNLDSNY